MADAIGGIARDQLKSIVERIERLEEEKAALADDIRQVYAEAKANGFDTRTLRTVVRLRKQDKDERAEQEALLALYLQALGMLADTPLGDAAIERERGELAANPPRKRGRGLKAAGGALKHALGTPVPLTEVERAKGQQAAFVGRDGTRMSIGVVHGGGGA